MKNENPAPMGSRASCVSFGDWTREALSPLALQIQRLVIIHAVRPELAAMLAAAIFGGGAYDC